MVVAVWLILFGPAAGSFVTALADRQCAGLGIARGRSRCTDCGKAIAPGDLVPLVSFALLRGRCRFCKAAIGWHIWIGEWAGLLLGALAVVWGETALERVLAALFLWLLLGLFQSDRRCLRLPDAMTIPLFLCGALLGALIHGPLATLVAAGTGFAALWLAGSAYRIWRGETGLGFGDVKMMAGISAAIGPLGVPWVTLVAALTALTTAAFAAVRGRPVTRTSRLAFGCHLALAGALILLVFRT
jgi:leader peptidase (prepilin peptidase) / N-methyltransferase